MKREETTGSPGSYKILRKYMKEGSIYVYREKFEEFCDAWKWFRNELIGVMIFVLCTVLVH